MYYKILINRSPNAIIITIIIIEIRGLHQAVEVETMQDQAHVLLSEYIRHQFPRQPTRYGRLLLMIPTLRIISGSALSKLFFNETIGNIPVEKLICDIFQNENAN